MITRSVGGSVTSGASVVGGKVIGSGDAWLLAESKDDESPPPLSSFKNSTATTTITTITNKKPPAKRASMDRIF